VSDARIAGARLRLNVGWPTNPQDARTRGQLLRLGPTVGAYRIAGNVYVDGVPDVPVSRKVRLFDRVTAACVRELWSEAATGAYAFEQIPKPADGYFVVAHDHTAVHNAVIKDRINAV